MIVALVDEVARTTKPLEDFEISVFDLSDHVSEIVSPKAPFPSIELAACRTHQSCISRWDQSTDKAAHSREALFRQRFDESERHEQRYGRWPIDDELQRLRPEVKRSDVRRMQVVGRAHKQGEHRNER